MRIASTSVLLLLLLTAAARADVRHEIAMPELPGYQTLKCDFHTHTMFSDGSVWPPVRVDEAWRQGLDVIAISDHIEYQPHADDVPTNHGRSNDLAARAAREKNLLFPTAAEITRDTPPGHFNAVFLKDVEPLDVEDFVEAVKRANEQGAFVFWNHQGWKGEERGRWLEVHTTLYDNKWLHGMEVCNGDGYFPSAHRWCLDKNLTMLGNSDIHSPDLRTQSRPDGHRTMTLVFSTERTLASVKEALVERRTAVWFNEQIIGREELLGPLFEGCIRVAKPHLQYRETRCVEIRNVSDLNITLERTGDLGPRELALPARGTSLVKVNVGELTGPVTLSYTATDFLIAPGTGLPVTLTIPAP